MIHENKYNLENYIFLRDLTWKLFESEGTSVVQETDRILSGIDIVGTDFLFVPAKYRKTTHEDVANLLSKKFGIGTLVINGDGHVLYEPGTGCQRQVHGGDTEFDTIQHVRQLMLGTAFAVTGMACISRAITIHSAELPVTRAIFSPLILPAALSGLDSRGVDNLYQTVARVAGSFRDACAVRTVIHTTAEVQKRVLAVEAKQTLLADTAGSPYMTLHEYKAVNRGYSVKRATDG